MPFDHDQPEQNRVRAMLSWVFQSLPLHFLLHLSQNCKVWYTKKELERKLTRRSQHRSRSKSQHLANQATPDIQDIPQIPGSPDIPDVNDQAIPYISTTKAPTTVVTTATTKTMTETTAKTTTNAGSQLTKVIV